MGSLVWPLPPLVSLTYDWAAVFVAGPGPLPNFNFRLAMEGELQEMMDLIAQLRAENEPES